MSSRVALNPGESTASPPGTGATSRQRLPALSGVAFGLLLLVGWFLSGGDAPNYTATDADWTAWAEDNSQRSGIGAFLILLAGSALLHFAGTVRSVLGRAEASLSGSVDLARVAFAGAVVGAAGIATAIVMVSAATSAGADADPVVSRAVTAASAGPYLVAAMGFATLLGSSGLSTLRGGAFPRWTGFVALIGSVGFLITFLTLVAGTDEDSVFGYGFLPGIVSLVAWSIGTSIAIYRAGTDDARERPRAAGE
jgi:hypothetical protein